MIAVKFKNESLIWCKFKVAAIFNE